MFQKVRPYVIRYSLAEGQWLTLCRCATIKEAEKFIVKHYATHRNSSYLGEKPDGSELDVSYVIRDLHKAMAEAAR